MPKLVANERFGLYGVTKKPNKDGLYRPVKIRKNMFTEPIGHSKIEDALTSMAHHLYGSGNDCRWVEITDKVCVDGMVCIEIDHRELLVTPSIIDFIDAREGTYRCFIIVNGDRTEYQWVVACLLGKIYLG